MTSTQMRSSSPEIGYPRSLDREGDRLTVTKVNFKLMILILNSCDTILDKLIEINDR
jgi:hypothetical protein